MKAINEYLIKNHPKLNNNKYKDVSEYTSKEADRDLVEILREKYNLNKTPDTVYGKGKTKKEVWFLPNDFEVTEQEYQDILDFINDRNPLLLKIMNPFYSDSINTIQLRISGSRSPLNYWGDSIKITDSRTNGWRPQIGHYVDL